MPETFIVYDERAIVDTDSAQVLDSFHSQSDAVFSDCVGYVYRYTVGADNELHNETFISATFQLTKQLQREAAK